MQFKLLPIIVLLIHPSSLKPCDPSFCNYEGECTINPDSNQKLCKCVAKFFEGPYCNGTIKKFCDPNPCENNGECENFFGQPYCKCTSGFYGQFCTSQKRIVNKFHIHYNHVAKFGITEYILITLEDFGDTKIDLEVFTLNYMIELTIAGRDEPGSFKYGKNLKKLARNFNIRNSELFDVDEGYYIVTKAVYWHLGTLELRTDVTEFTTTNLLYQNTFDVFVYKEKEADCLPIIKQDICANPKRAMRVKVDTVTMIEPIIMRSCGGDSKMTVKWTVWNYVHTIKVFEFQSNEKWLKIPRYTLWFDAVDDFSNLYVIEAAVFEISKDQKRSGKASSRCYIIVDMRRPQAIIFGGPSRLANINKDITLDASKSRELSLPVGVDQHLRFLWHCQSEEQNQEYCRSNMSTAPNFIIPAFSLGKEIRRYTYIVAITSTVTLRSHKTQQDILPVVSEVLELNILCIKNCHSEYFYDQNELHLMVDCKTCNSKSPIQYKWSWQPLSQDQTINLPSIGKRLIILGLELPPDASFYIKAELEQDNLTGYSLIQLKKRYPPGIGNCFPEPTSGTEFETIFTIFCQNFIGSGSLLNFNFLIGNTSINSIYALTACTFSARLFQSIPGFAVIDLDVCDEYSICGHTSFMVALTNMIILEDSKAIKDFLENGNASIYQFLQSNDRISIMSQIDVVSKNIRLLGNVEEKLDLVLFVLRVLKDFKTHSLESIQQLSSVLWKISNTTQVNSEVALLIGEIFQSISEQLLQISNDKEISFEDVVSHKGFVSLKALEIIDQLSFEIDDFPVHNLEFQEPDDPFEENYPDYGELSYDVIDKCYNWQTGFKGVQNVINSMGAIIRNLKNPGESPLVLESEQILIIGFVMEKSNLSLPSISNGGSSVKLSASILSELFEAHRTTEIAIQIGFSKTNLFWWYPEQYKSNQTDGIFLNHYGINEHKTNHDDGIKLGETFEILFKLKNIEENNFKEIKGFVNATKDMPIYQTRLPFNSVLIYKFQYTEDDLKILILRETKPRHFMFKENFEIIRKTLRKNDFKLENDLDHETTAYIAILPFQNTTLEKIHFNFKILTFSCTTWDVANQNWTSEYCKLGFITNLSHIQCRCNHMSSFGSKIFVTPNTISLPRDIVESILVNLIIIGFFIGYILIFGLCFLFAWYRDREDGQSVVLTNQTAETNFHYIITIVTGNRPFSGTTANISIQLHGDQHESEKILLFANASGEIFRQDSTQTVEISTPNHLGDLQAISLSHDNYGRYPSWFCHMVRIKDKTTKKEYIFLVETWLSLVYNNVIECKIQVATRQQLHNFKFLFKEYVTVFFADTKSWQLLSTGHFKGILNRREKIMVIFVGTMVCYAINAMYFQRTTLMNYEEERETYQYIIVRITQVLYSLLGCFVSFIVCHSIISCLTKSKDNIENYELVYGLNE